MEEVIDPAAILWESDWGRNVSLGCVDGVVGGVGKLEGGDKCYGGGMS